MPAQLTLKSGRSHSAHLGPLDSHLAAFSLSLSSKGYKKSSLRSKVQVFHNFNRWLVQHHLSLGDITEETVKTFFDDCQRPGYVRRGDLAGVLALLKYLREKGVASSPPPHVIHDECRLLEDRFLAYLKNERRLSNATLRNYLPPVQLFLRERFGTASLKLEDVSPSDVTGFVARHARRLMPKRTQLMGTALRSFLRFSLFARGNSFRSRRMRSPCGGMVPVNIAEGT